MYRLCTFISELSSFHPCHRLSAAPIPCLPPAPSRPFFVFRLPTSSANERLLAPACGQAPSRLGGWAVRPSWPDFITVEHHRPRSLKTDASRAIHARLVASRVRLGSRRSPFSASRTWCAARHLLALDLHALASFATAPHSPR